ncbi:MAG: VanW family protein [Anaerolineales bacterium]|nr:VanW family protein [Anaerolineales bacterium]
MQTSLTQSGSRIRLRRTTSDYLFLLALLILFTLLLGAATWTFWHTNRIYTGVTVGGVPVGGLTRGQALDKVHGEALAYQLPSVSLTYVGQQWPLAITPVQTTVDWADAVNRAYLVGREGSLAQRAWEQLRGIVGGAIVNPELVIDPALLRTEIERIAARVAKPGLAARQIGAVAVPAQAGVAVDVNATLAGVLEAVEQADLHATALAPLVATTSAPPAPTPATTLASGADEALVVAPLMLRAESGMTMALDPAVLQRLTTSKSPLEIDAEGLRSYLTELAHGIEVPARDARLRFDPNSGGLIVLQSSQPGRTLDIDGTAQGVVAALAAGQTEAPLILNPVQPTVDSNNVAAMGIRELVASASTYFAGSSASRVRNIEVAADKFDGVVVPPGGVFSFNDVVRDVSSANGFEDSLIIWGDRTAVGVGGGVCQVSTTIFRTAYEGGFPIVARANHGYVVDWYGDPGMDATIFTPTVDFQFRNDTGAHLLLEPIVDSANGSSPSTSTAPAQTVP